MAVAKRQEREKPAKIRTTEGQRTVRGPEWGLQVGQTVLLASPACIGRPKGGKNTRKDEPKRSPSPLGAMVRSSTLFSSRLWVGRPSRFEDGFSCYLLTKIELYTDLSKSHNTVCPRPESCDASGALMSVAPNLCCDETEPRSIHSPNSDCSHEIKRHLLLGRKATANLEGMLKIRDITLLTKVRIVRAMFFPVVMYGCESWTLKKAEG